MHGEVLQDMIYPHSSLYLFCSWKLLVFFHQTCLPSCISWSEAGEETSRSVQDFSGAACWFFLPWIVTKWGVIQVLEITDDILDIVANTLTVTDTLEYSWFHRCVWKDSCYDHLCIEEWLNCMVYIPHCKVPSVLLLLTYRLKVQVWINQEIIFSCQYLYGQQTWSWERLPQKLCEKLIWTYHNRPCKKEYQSCSHLLEMSLDCFRLIAVQFELQSKL